MTKSPLKTATRVLSIATLVVASFAVWAITTQDLNGHREPRTAGKHDSAEASPSRNPSSRIGSKLSTHLQNKPRELADDSQQAPRRTFPRVQPEVGRVAENSSKLPTQDELAVEQPAATPLFSNATGRNRSRDPLYGMPVQELEVSRSGDSQSDLDARRIHHVQEAEASRNSDRPVFSQVDTRLSTLQRQIDQLAQVQAERQTEGLQQATDLLKQLNEQKNSNKLNKLLGDIEKARQSASVEPPAAKSGSKPKVLDGVESEPDAEEFPAKPGTSDSQKQSVIRAEPVVGHPEKFSFQFQDAEISEALAMLGQLSGLNILVGRGVTGKVPAANLQDVTAEEALDAITRTLGQSYEREGNLIFVYSQADALQRKQAARKTMTKIYRPRYISSKELQALVTPLLTKVVGLIAMTNPAEAGLELSRSKVGGDSISQTDAMLVVDYPEVIAQIDKVVQDLDVPPAQVVIEAMILNVKLTENMKLGVNFALLNEKNKQLLTTGNGSQINSSVGFPNDTSLIPAAGDFIANSAGLKYGFLAGNISGFVEALESLTDTSVVASPSLRVLNKQKAELIIGERLGYRTTTFNGTQTVENINFLEVGTKLILRPFVAEDGLVRMEIHPERSDGKVVSTTGLPESRTTEVTSNVMVRDGTTIVIGGLIEEQVNQGQSRIPGLAGVPIVGNLFKNKTNDTTRTELIVLITPRVIRDSDAECEGSLAQVTNEQRHEEFRNKISHINRSNLARVEYERAARYFEEGDATRAKLHIDQALRHNRNDTEAIRLRDQIAAAVEDKNWFKKLRRKPPETYHRIPSAPMSPPNGEAVYEFETQPNSINVPPLVPTVLPAPASAPSASNSASKPNADRRVSRK